MSLELLTLILVVTLTVMLMAGQWTAFALGICGVLVLYLSKGVLGLTAAVVGRLEHCQQLHPDRGADVPADGRDHPAQRRQHVLLSRRRRAARPAARRPAARQYRKLRDLLRGLRLERRDGGHRRHGRHPRDAASAATTPKTVFGSLAAGGTLGILIPPSIVMVLYGALVEELIARLFMAGVLPGLLMAGIFMIFIAIQLIVIPAFCPTARRKDQADPAADHRCPARLSRSGPPDRRLGQHLLRLRHAHRGGRARRGRRARSRRAATGA